jgi:hypothetical protein
MALLLLHVPVKELLLVMRLLQAKQGLLLLLLLLLWLLQLLQLLMLLAPVLLTKQHPLQLAPQNCCCCCCCCCCSGVHQHMVLQEAAHV